MAARGAKVDDATLNRGVVKYTPLIVAARLRRCGFSRARAGPMACQIELSSTRAALIWQHCNVSTSSCSSRILGAKSRSFSSNTSIILWNRNTASYRGSRGLCLASRPSIQPTQALAGIETAHMIQVGQRDGNEFSTFQQFAALAE